MKNAAYAKQYAVSVNIAQIVAAKSGTMRFAMMMRDMHTNIEHHAERAMQVE